MSCYPVQLYPTFSCYYIQLSPHFNVIKYIYCLNIHFIQYKYPLHCNVIHYNWPPNFHFIVDKYPPHLQLIAYNYPTNFNGFRGAIQQNKYVLLVHNCFHYPRHLSLTIFPHIFYNTRNFRNYLTHVFYLPHLHNYLINFLLSPTF